MSPAKKTTRKTKAKKAPARRKAPAKKATPTKARATKKKAAAKASPAKPEATTKKAAAKASPAKPEATTKKAATAAKKKPAEKAPAKKRAATKAVRSPPSPPLHPPADAHPKFGVKHTCFRCAAKFYDLFRPEPLCPKCGADQRQAPKAETKRKPPAPPKRAAKRAMAPLLDEEDEEPVFDELEESVLDMEPAGAAFDDPAAESEDDSYP